MTSSASKANKNLGCKYIHNLIFCNYIQILVPQLKKFQKLGFKILTNKEAKLCAEIDGNLNRLSKSSL